MNIDISRVNLLEKDIEDWLYENPQALDREEASEWMEPNPIERWIGRQYQLPSGIADLIGVRENKKLVVVEIKNVPINKAAVLQVCRYTNDLKHIMSGRMNYPHLGYGHEPLIDMILVGPSVDDQTFTEAQAVGVRVFAFAAHLTLAINPLVWNREHYNRVQDQQEQIAARPEWEIYGLTIQEDIAIRYGAQSEPQGTDEYSDIILEDGLVLSVSDIKEEDDETDL